MPSPPQDRTANSDFRFPCTQGFLEPRTGLNWLCWQGVRNFVVPAQSPETIFFESRLVSARSVVEGGVGEGAGGGKRMGDGTGMVRGERSSLSLSKGWAFSEKFGVLRRGSGVYVEKGKLRCDVENGVCNVWHFWGLNVHLKLRGGNSE